MNALTLARPERAAALATAPITRLDLGANGIRMTPEEFLAIDDCDECFRYELINGVVVVNPPPSDSEAGPNDELGRLLRNYKADHPQGKSLDDTFYERDVRTSVGIRRVDRAIYAGLGRKPHSRKDLPTIIVEFVSPGKRAYLRDYEEKRAEYLAVGTQEYWVIDRFARTMTVFFAAPADPAYRVVLEKEAYNTPLLTGFELPLQRLLQLADESNEEGSP